MLERSLGPGLSTLLAVAVAHGQVHTISHLLRKRGRGEAAQRVAHSPAVRTRSLRMTELEAALARRDAEEEGE
jgi:hypothetical protein